MKKYSRSSYKFIQAFMSLMIIVVLVSSYFYVWLNYYNDLLLLPYFRRGHYLIIVVYVALLFFILLMYGALRVSYYRTGELIYSFIFSIVIVNFITWLQICLIGTWILTPVPMIMLTVVEIPFIILWILISKKILRSLIPCERLLLIYKEKSMLELARKLDTRKDSFFIANSVELSSLKHCEERVEGCVKNTERKDKEDLYFEYGRPAGIDAVVLGADIVGNEREELLCECFRNNIPVYLIPQTGDILQTGAKRIHLFDTPLHYLSNNGLQINQRIIKKLFDVVFSLIILIIFSPAMLICAISIFLYDRGPVFYKQKRVTKNNKEFNMIKFRSMSVTAESESGARLAEKYDKRITPVGKIIRQLHIDELPQLINILKGDMSLVGPRPERKEIIEQYMEQIPNFDFRLKVKAGLSGYAQVYGKYNTTPEDKLKLDLYYIENYNFWLDLKLLIMTFKVLLQRETTEGIQEGQTTAQKTEQAEQIKKQITPLTVQITEKTISHLSTKEGQRC